MAWGDHSSRRRIAPPLKQSTRATGWRNPYAAPIRSCSRWGLPCHCCCQQRGAPLPHHFDLTMPRHGGIISVALSLKSPSPDVIRHRSSLEPGLSSRMRIPAYRRSPDPLADQAIAALSPYSNKSANRMARHSPSMIPSTFSGRNRRWNAINAAGPSAMP